VLLFYFRKKFCCEGDPVFTPTSSATRRDITCETFCNELDILGWAVSRWCVLVEEEFEENNI
jgi:hypothetical protein